MRGNVCNTLKNIIIPNYIHATDKEYIISKFQSDLLKTEKLTSLDDLPRFALRLNDKISAICTIQKDRPTAIVVLEIMEDHNYSKLG